MRYLIVTLLFLAVFQQEAQAQHRKRSRYHQRRSTHHVRKHQRHTYYRTHTVAQPQAPSPYRGENTPINDGQKKNKHRNMNYNTGQPLPSNNGR